MSELWKGGAAMAVAAAVGILAIGCASPPAPGSGEKAPGAAEKPSAGESTPREDPDLTLARELLERDRAVLFGSEDGEPLEARLAEGIRADIAELDFKDDPKGREVARSLFGENPLLSEHNPLLSNRERERWLAAAIKNVGQEAALEHLREEARLLAEGKVDRAHWYEHVAACEKVCNKIVSGLLHSHVQRVRELPHRLILFGQNRAAVDEEASGEIDDLLAELAAAPQEGGYELLLIGRASRSGAKEYNRRLSERRVEAVRSDLEARGWGEEHLRGFGLGYEPPQITEEIARLYDLDPSLSDERRNQSVLVVAHPVAPPATSPATVGR